jgi:hypothetical protein
MYDKKVIGDICAVLGFNSMTFMTVTFVDLENILKMILLIVSILYTIQKMMHKKNQK